MKTVKKAFAVLFSAMFIFLSLSVTGDFTAVDAASVRTKKIVSVVYDDSGSMENEKLYRSADEIPDDAGYFTLIIAKEKKESSI